MSTLFGAAGSFLDRYVISYALGAASGRALAPLVEDLANTAWSEHTDRKLNLGLAAQVAADFPNLYDTMATEVTFTGYDRQHFDWTYGATLTAPGTGQLLTMLRRASEQPIDFEHGLRKNKLETQWDDAVRNLQWERIPAPDLAYMVVRGVVPDDGTLASSLPTQADHLSLPPQLGIDTIAEAAKTGWDPERFAALVARSGLAMGPVQAANAYFRGILTLNDYLLTIARGDLFPAFAQPVLEVSREILTAHDYAELQLRGYYDRATRLGNTAKHGMSDADSDLLFDVMGRGLSYHDVVKAKARGGVFGETPPDIDPDILWALQRSNLRPEVYGLAWANRYSLPSAFVIKSLLTGGTISEAEGEQLYLDIGWPPDLAKLVATAEAKGTTARPKTATAAQLAEQYKAGTLAPGDYTTALQALGYTPEAATSVKASVDAAPLVAARTANLTKLRTYVAKGQLTDAQAATFLEAENVDPAVGTMLVAAWKREAAIEAAATTPPAA